MHLTSLTPQVWSININILIDIIHLPLHRVTVYLFKTNKSIILQEKLTALDDNFYSKMKTTKLTIESLTPILN